jgi:hypothetical protein
MKRISLTLMLILMSACGGATFESVGVTPGTEAGLDQPGDQPSDEIGDTTNPEKIPLRDVIDNPALLDQFACVEGDLSSVEICHFPEGSGNSHTQCIGRAAVDTHYDHVYPETGEFDYLGPCRP